MIFIKNTLFFCSLTLIFSSCTKQEIIQKINYTLPYKFNYEIEDKLAKDSLPWRFQIAASDYASKGNYKDALRVWDSIFPIRERTYTSTEIDSIKNSFTPTNALNFITSEATKTQITIINEAHHSSLHRNFTKQLLQKLYNHGYKHLGLEALANGNEKDIELNTRKYPIQTTGYYTKDPQFGELIREALSIGFHVFAYEQTADKNGKEREIVQAKNIQQVINKFPNEKILIHCGFDHALEGIHQSWEKALAERLKEYTNIDPLTINQVFYSEKSNPKFNHPLLKVFNINEATVLINKKDRKPMPYIKKDSWSDIAVLHPNTTFVNEKANWLNNQVSLNLSNYQLTYPIMVLAYLKNEDISTAVPVDIVELKDKNSSCFLNLKKGEYNIVITNSKDSFLLHKKIK
ncbi:hypothetical protein [Tenacibaculum sp. 47A_GOM-205m]|uniref:hypothetical protein n=1 Tax=Tenacibaculum sp. 47A_GOM-205m TaxID=1380384 RepID=UPI00048CDD43|nr:hypothetical protein [Tenacibaculum sp. 47A_GOM-205m]